MSREDILKKNGIKTQTPNTVQNISNNTRSEILRKNGITSSPTQMSVTPTFKTVDEALEYAKANNINVSNSSVENAKKAENANKLKNEIPKENIVEMKRKGIGDVIGDAAENLWVNTLGGTANTINALNSVNEKLGGRDATSINAQELLNYNNQTQKWYNNSIDAIRNSLNFTMPNLKAVTSATSFMQTPNSAYSRLEQIYKAYPDNLKVKKLYEEITNGTYSGTAEELNKKLNDIQISLYNDFVDKYTRDEAEAVAKRQQRNADEYGAFGEMAMNAFGQVGNMVPSMLTSVIAPPVGMATLGLNAGGNAMGQAINEGAGYNQAMAYGTLSGLAEAGIESLSGGLSNRLMNVKGVFNPSNWTKGIKNNVLKNIADTGLDIFGEGIEEVAAAFIDPILQRLTYDPNAQMATGEELWLSFRDSILPTLLMQGGGVALNKVNEYHAKQVEKIRNSNLPQDKKTELINETTSEKDKIVNEIQNAQQPVQNITPQSSNTQIQQQTNEVLPQQTEKQQNANIVQNNAQIAQNIPNNEQISQNNVQNAQDLQKTGQNDTERFSQQVEQWKKNQWDITKDLVVLEHTPQIYQDLGLRDLTITVNPEKLTSIYYSKGRGKKNFHGLEEIVKQIPEALKRPLNIVESNTRDNSIIVITDLADKNGNIITVPIAIDDQGNLSIEEFFNGEAVNKMSSAYGRENYDYNVSKKGNYYDGWMQENLKNNRIVYDIDEGIIKKRVNGRWLQLPNAVDSLNITNDVLDNNIIQSNENYVNTQENIMPSVEQLQARDLKQGEEISNTLNMKKPKLEDIANLAEKEAQLPTMTYKQRADKNTPYRRKFWDNVESSKIVSKDVKEQVNMTNYERKHNNDVLEKMKERLDTEPMKVAREWFNKDIKKATEQDVALGAILLERYQAEGKIEEAVDVVEKLADMGTEAGRTVQMYSIFQRLTPEGMMMYQQRKLNSALETVTAKQTGKWVEQNKDKFKLTEDDATFITAKVQEAQYAATERQKQIALAEIESRINDKLPPEAGQSVKAFRRIAMLFNPKTQVRNVAGNITVMPLNYVTDLVATGIDKAIAKRTGVRTTALPNVKTIGKGFVKGASETIDDYRRGIRTTPTGSRYEIQNNAKSFNENTNSRVKNTINNKLNAIDRILSTTLELGDRPFYEAAYQNALEGQMKANKVTEPTQEMIDIASNVALAQTWQDSNNYTQAVLGIRSAFNKININGFGLGDLIIPFAKTPANLTKAMVDYSPLGFIPALINYNNMNKAMSRGDMTAMQQRKFVDSVGKAVAGTLLYALAYGLVQNGAVTGSADEDKDVANFEKNVLGIQPYSIKIGDKTFTYNWAQPLATPFAIMVDAKKMSAEDSSFGEILVNAFKVAGDQLVANSFLQGIQELLSNEYGNESAMDNLVNALMDLPTQFTPTLLGQIATQFDSTKRQTFENGDTVGTMVNEVKNKIPGAKNTLAPQVNTFGEEIQNYGGDNNPFNVFLNPANVSSTNASEDQKELYALYEVTKDKTIFPRQAPYSVSGGGEKVSLSSQDRATYQKASGQYVTENLGALFDSEFYQSLNNEKKVEVVAKIVSDADTTAKDIWIDTDSTEDLAKRKKELGDIPLVDYYNAWIAQKGITADKNWKGDSISGSKKKKQIQAINEAVSDDLTPKQKETLYGIFNVSGY